MPTDLGGLLRLLSVIPLTQITFTQLLDRDLLPWGKLDLETFGYPIPGRLVLVLVLVGLALGLVLIGLLGGFLAGFVVGRIVVFRMRGLPLVGGLLQPIGVLAGSIAAAGAGCSIGRCSARHATGGGLLLSEESVAIQHVGHRRGDGGVGLSAVADTETAVA
jgi:hypothetical protein